MQQLGEGPLKLELKQEFHTMECVSMDLRAAAECAWNLCVVPQDENPGSAQLWWVENPAPARLGVVEKCALY
jgi:hypothetical protein